MRLFFLILGFLALGIGTIGIFVPLLPTTSLILLSAFCFARSSKKFHSWLIQHPRFGKLIQDWNEKGSISKKAKISAISMMFFSVILSLFFKISVLALVIQIIILSVVCTFVVTRPNS